MPTLHTYSDSSEKSGFYVKHSFASNGRLFHVVYQVDSHAEKVFQEKELDSETPIPKGLFNQLRNEGHLYTQKSGVQGEHANQDYEYREDEDALEKLTEDSRRWVIRMIVNHPSVKITNANIYTHEFSCVNIPVPYGNQLLEIAKKYDGTNFFENLNCSYKHEQKNLKEAKKNSANPKDCRRGEERALRLHPSVEQAQLK